MSRIQYAAAAATEDLMCASKVSLVPDGGVAFSDALTALNRALELLRRDHGSPPLALAAFVKAWADAMDAGQEETSVAASAPKPTTNITRESLEERRRVLSAQIKELPTPEVFRMVADFIDTKQWTFASQTAAYAVTRLERERPSEPTRQKLELPQ